MRPPDELAVVRLLVRQLDELLDPMASYRGFPAEEIPTLMQRLREVRDLAREWIG